MAITCEACDTGTFLPRKKYRLSEPIVAIGYIVLITCVLGILFSALIFLMFAEPHHAASGVMSDFAIVMGGASVVGGLLGWLCVKKKRVLECTSCKAIIEAA
jgi:hypothetical protein